MCPLCLAALTQMVVAAVSAGGGVTALVAKTARPPHDITRIAMDVTRMEETMESPRVVSRPEWLAARKALLALEKEETRRRDALAAARRRLPMVQVEQDYWFDAPEGRVSLGDLFKGRQQLIVYHFMFDPAWEEGCKSCSHFMDNAAGSIVHLAARDTSFVVVSRAPLAKIETFKQRMDWHFPWVSSFGSEFNYDFGVTIDPERAEYEYNYTSAASLLAGGKIWFAKGELPGISVFVRDGERILHSYSGYQRALDLPLNTYNFLDLTPLGRQEEDGRIQAWIRHHDRY